MHDSCRPREHGAGLVGMPADRHDIIELQITQVVQMLEA